MEILEGAITFYQVCKINTLGEKQLQTQSRTLPMLSDLLTRITESFQCFTGIWVGQRHPPMSPQKVHLNWPTKHYLINKMGKLEEIPFSAPQVRSSHECSGEVFYSLRYSFVSCDTLEWNDLASIDISNLLSCRKSRMWEISPFLCTVRTNGTYRDSSFWALECSSISAVQQIHAGFPVNLP